ncbi:MAG: PPOX class F420-dependent oxidoreductase [Anaerolineae bacterium]
MAHPLDAFDGHRYLNLETFRRTGEGVKTPVWFVREGDTIYVWTQADSGKAKRIRRDSRVRIAPCDARGKLLGDWMEARAEADASPDAVRYVERLMARKYGLAFRGFWMLGKLQRARHTALRIHVDETGP